MITRRQFAGGTGATLIGFGLMRKTEAHAAAGGAEDLAAQLARIEAESGGRLGLAVLDTGSGFRAGHRVDERFPLCSTFKMLAAACVLARVDRGEERLDRRVMYSKDDLVTYSPATERHVEDGMTLAAICKAAVTLSDNTAGNLMLASFGGPAGLTAFARSLGDDVTRLDRIEPALNEGKPGDPRDTTSPAAMLADMNALILGDALKPASREQLITWLVGSKTGGKRLRAGFPKDWRVGDKTGSADGIANDVAVAWPANGAAILVTAYLTESAASGEQRNAAIAAVGHAVASALAR